MGRLADMIPGRKGPVNLNASFFFFACYSFDTWHSLCTGQAALKQSWLQKNELSRSICLHTGHCILAFLPQPGVQHFASASMLMLLSIKITFYYQP